MANVVTTASTVICGHGGKVTTVGTPKLTVAGSPVVVAAGIVGKPVVGCATPASSTSKPCMTAVSVDPPSLSKKLTVSGAPVALSSLSGTTDGEVGGVTPQKLLAATGAPPLLTTV